MNTPQNLDAGEKLKTLTGLVNQFSPSGQEGAAAAWLTERMQTLGYAQAYVDEAGNAIGIMGDGPRQAVLLGHIDTVPGLIPVRIEGDFLFGRGAVDAKGALAAFVDAVAEVKPGKDQQLIVIGAVDEERDSSGARHILARYRPEFAIIGEPSGWDRITLGYKGSAWATITIRRSLSHTAGQEQSACEAAVSIWETIQAWCEDYNQGIERGFHQVSPTLRGMSSGGDGFEEWASLRVGVRLPPGMLPSDWYRQLEGLTQGTSLAKSGFAIPAYQAEKNTRLVRSFLASIREENGKPGFVLKTGTADMNIVAPAWGCPAVAYGPGDSSLDHTPNEHLSLHEYGLAVKVLKNALMRLE